MANITITVPDDKVAELKAAFLASTPKPEDFVGTDVQWIKAWIRLMVLDRVRKGKKIIANQSLPAVDGLVDES